jgi:hypothetical protein
MAKNKSTSKAKATKQKSAADSQPVDDTLETVLKAFNQSWEYTSSSWHDRWQDNYKLYNNERIKKGYKGISDTFVPMTFGTVETLTSALFGTKPKFGYLPPSNKADQNTDILNALIDFYWDKDQWSMKIINTGRGMVREGTSVDYFCWEIDHPKLINVAIRDFFIDPNAFELDETSTQYCGRRYLTTFDELESFEVVDVDAKPDDNGDYPLKKKYKNLEKLKGTDTGSNTVKTGGKNQEQTTDKQEKDMFYGSTLNEPQDNQVEVIEYWTVDKVISIANRKVVIENEENYYKAKDRANGSKFPQGILPFSPARNYTDGSLFYAKSDIDFIADQQEDLNDFSNQQKDAISFNLNSTKTLDPKYGHLMKEIENLPGAIYPIEAGMLAPVPTNVIPPEAFNERQNIKAEIREATASNEIVKGAPQSGPGSKQTATEVNAQIAGAGQRINLKVTQLENEYFHRMAKIIFRMVQLYVTEPMMIRIIGKDGVRWEEFNPEDFAGIYEPRVQLDITLQNRKQQQSNDAANMLKAFISDPNVNQKELTKLVLQRGFDLDPDEVDKLMTPEAPMMPPEGMPGMPPVPGQAPPEQAGAGAPPIDPAVLALLSGGQGAPEADTGPTPTDVTAHPATGEPVLAGDIPQ